MNNAATCGNEWFSIVWVFFKKQIGKWMHEELQFSEKSSGAVFHAVLFIMFDCKVLEKKIVLGKDQINFL